MLYERINSLSKRLSIFLLIGTLGLWSCKKEQDLHNPTSSKRVIALAKAQPDLTLFVEAAEAADIELHLQQGTAYTLLAPTDSSFMAYLHAHGHTSVSDLKNSMGADRFLQFVSYHILEKRVRIENISNGYVVTFAETENGDRLHSYMIRNDIKVNINGGDASFSESSIFNENGVVHKINGVLEPLNLKGLVRVNTNFSKFNEAIKFAGPDIENILTDTQDFHTMFAPTDAAFNTFLNFYGYSDITELMNLLGQPLIIDAIKYHLIQGKFRAEDFQNQQYQTLLQGGSLSITKDSSGTILISDDKGNALAKIINTNIVGVNGIMHTIEKVLEY